MRAVARLVLGLLLVGCGGAVPTPQIIYVTPPPTIAGIQTISNATPSPTTAEQRPSQPARTAPPTPRVTVAPVPAKLDIEVVDYGFSLDGKSVSYAAIIRNPNDDEWAVTDMSVQVTLFADTQPVHTGSAFVTDLLPGIQTAILGYEFELDATPDRMEVRLGEPDWTTIDFTPGRFAFEDVRTSKREFGGYVTRGTARSHFETRQENAELVAVYRNEAGEIIGGDSTYIDFVDPGQAVGFEITTLVDVKGVASTEMFWAW